MGLGECLRSGRFVVALEITPPQRLLPAVLLRRARLLGNCAQSINVIQRPGRLPSLDASLALRGAGFDPVWHLVTRGRSRAEIAADLAVAREGGIEAVLCIRGDHEASDLPDAPSIREVVSMAVRALPGAVVGATLNQHAADREAVLRNLLPKLRAGASYVQTQPVFDVEGLRRYVEVLGERAPGTGLIAMVMPVLSGAVLARIEERLGVVLPAPVRRRFAGSAPGRGWEAFAGTIAALVESKLADGVAVMTFETDPPPETGQRIVVALRAAGIDC
jgi:methylenetetrahydrofolate reductase (NADPH)